MTRAHGEPAVAELGQNLADRAFMQFDTEAPPQLVAQVHPPPAYHSVPSRIGPRLDQLDQFNLLLRCEFRLRTWRLQVMQTAQALSVVAVHPIPQGLAIHAASLGRQLAIRTVEDQRDSQHPPRRRTVLLPASRRAKLRCRQIKPCDRYRCSHRCRSSQEPASSQTFSDLGIPI